jgi:galactose mutarotase-like enzyme
MSSNPHHPRSAAVPLTMQRITLNNGVLRMDVLPELGGKIISLVRIESGHEYLCQPSSSDGTYRRARYGDPFNAYSSGGFDDCFPTISDCIYPLAPFQGLELPDHGELWSVPWEAEAEREVVCLRTRGIRLPYRFSKRLRLDGPELVLDYELTNEGKSALDYLWAAHPLLRIEAGDEVILPPEIGDLLIEWSKDDRLGGRGETCRWPLARQRSGAEDDLSRIKPPQSRYADKLFTPRLRHGYAALYSPRNDEAIVFRFHTEVTPFLGIWLCQGGHSHGHAEGEYAAALEPCSGRSDSLATAIERRECQSIGAGDTVHWSLRVELRRGRPNLAGDSLRVP